MGQGDVALRLALTPGGTVTLDAAEAPSEPWQSAVAAAFGRSWPEGLLVLGGATIPLDADRTAAFWRDFAGRYNTRLCHTPESGDLASQAIEPPGEGELATVVLNVPPMRGAEYLAVEVLRAIWRAMDATARELIGALGGLAAFLKAFAPAYARVGRVCFHLAENKADADYPFAFLATYASGLSSGGGVKQLPLGRALQEYAGAGNKAALVKLLSPVHAAAGKSPLIAELVESSDIFHPLAWTPAEAHRFLLDVPSCEDSGVLVRVPDWWRKRARPRAAVTIGQKKQSVLGTDALLDFQVALALGDETLSQEELERLLAGEDGLVMLRGQWVEVDRQKLREALDHWRTAESASADGTMSFAEAMRLLAGAPKDLNEDGAFEADRDWALVRAGDWLRGVLSGLRGPEALDDGKADRAFRGTLRPYQRTGVNWLRFCAELGLGVCLADDMGLGKTIQVLALLLRRRGRGPSLLIVPASLLGNWRAEAEQFAPSLRLLIAHASQTPREELLALAERPEAELANVDLVVTSYGTAARQKWLAEMDWDLAVLDEAQAIKNPATHQARAVKRLRARARVALTGTPIENRLGDLWSLFDFLDPGLLGGPKRFQQFVRQLERQEHSRFGPLRKLVSPYILRRLKTDRRIIADLPEKTEMNVYCGLSKRQAALYARSVRELQSALDGADGMQRRGMVLAYLLRFKQICNHPSQFLGDGHYAPADSGKFGRLATLCEEIASRQEKALVFTQFRGVTEPLAEHLRGVFGREGAILHGGTRVKRRKEIVDAFQREDGPPFFVLSIKAGGTGLNLTAACHVVHFDRWWNPAVEDQATDRAFRIGQKRNVLVHKFITSGTVEERIDQLIAEKRALSDGILRGGAETALTEMSDDELIQMVSLDIERARI